MHPEWYGMDFVILGMQDVDSLVLRPGVERYYSW